MWIVQRCFVTSLLAATALLGGCAITIQQPTEGATVTLPAKTKVVITGNASYNGLKVAIDGVDVSSQMVSMGPSRDEGDLTVAPGSHILTASADVYCWYCGGPTHSTDSRKFTVISHGFIDISAGETHTCGVDLDNRAFCWGDNTHGQLGTGTLPDLSCGLDPQQQPRLCQPAPVEVSGALRFRTVSAGDGHSCGLTTGGDVFCWGHNDRGQLGNASFTDSRVPVKA
ncbi:MAG TPA: hypothetical protein VGP22_09675, partial [Albitalea sp.]|nr:hypothetical protein [Albitalea sp.]